MSLAMVIDPPASCSGLAYCGVSIGSMVGAASTPRSLAIPKSTSFTCGASSPPTSTFAGLRSRCTSSARCAPCTMVATWRSSARRARSDRRRWSHQPSMRSPSTYSMAIHGRPSASTPLSIKRAMPASESCARRRRSRSKRPPSSSRSGRLIAARWSRCAPLPAASHTSPLPPRPSGACRVQSPSCSPATPAVGTNAPTAAPASTSRRSSARASRRRRSSARSGCAWHHACAAASRSAPSSSSIRRSASLIGPKRRGSSAMLMPARPAPRPWRA